tara:strand:+ start:401 stop:634 length:234 start_codon:yes stop_codon:yes gene_type:complete
MKLRSGRTLKTIPKTQISDMDAAEILLDLTSNSLYNRRVNKIVNTVPKKLKENCEICLREVIKESLTNGINIKFEIR